MLTDNKECIKLAAHISIETGIHIARHDLPTEDINSTG